jgi:hypothetical protein
MDDNQLSWMDIYHSRRDECFSSIHSWLKYIHLGMDVTHGWRSSNCRQMSYIMDEWHSITMDGYNLSFMHGWISLSSICWWLKFTIMNGLTFICKQILDVMDKRHPIKTHVWSMSFIHLSLLYIHGWIHPSLLRELQTWKRIYKNRWM